MNASFYADSANVHWVPEAFHARFPVSVKSYKVTRSCLRSAADEAPRRTREKTSGTQGSVSAAGWNKARLFFFLVGCVFAGNVFM